MLTTGEDELFTITSGLWCWLVMW